MATNALVRFERFIWKILAKRQWTVGWVGQQAAGKAYIGVEVTGQYDSTWFDRAGNPVVIK